MTVAITSSTPSHTYESEVYYFCSEHCQQAFAAEPERYLRSA
jgi:YHS domain-containing protein